MTVARYANTVGSLSAKTCVSSARSVHLRRRMCVQYEYTLLLTRPQRMCGIVYRSHDNLTHSSMFSGCSKFRQFFGILGQVPLIFALTLMAVYVPDLSRHGPMVLIWKVRAHCHVTVFLGI